MLIMLGMLIDLVIFHFSQIMKIPTARSPDNRYNTAWWVGLNGVCDSWMHDGVTYSYGYKIASLSGHT